MILKNATSNAEKPTNNVKKMTANAKKATTNAKKMTANVKKMTGDAKKLTDNAKKMTGKVKIEKASAKKSASDRHNGPWLAWNDPSRDQAPAWSCAVGEAPLRGRDDAGA